MTEDAVRTTLIAWLEALPVASAGARDTLRHVESGRAIATTASRWFTVQHTAQRTSSHGCLVRDLEHLVTIYYPAAPTSERRITADAALIEARASSLHLDNAGIYNAVATVAGTNEGPDGELTLQVSIITEYVADNALVA